MMKYARRDSLELEPQARAKFERLVGSVTAKWLDLNYFSMRCDRWCYY